MRFRAGFYAERGRPVRVAQRLALPWRLLTRPEQKLFLLEVTHPAEETERAAAALTGVRAWTFDVLDEHPGS